MLGINYSKEEILDGFKKAEAERSYCLFTNLIDKNNLPQWSDFMNAAYSSASQDMDNILDGQINKSKEYLVGKLIIQAGVYFNFKGDYLDNIALFPQVLNLLRITGEVPLGFYGPKVSIGPHFVIPHQDRWHAATLQCEGETIWTLKDEKYISGEVSKFEKDDPNAMRIVLKPGDFLYFSQKLYHQIEVEGPRASLLFNSNGIVDVFSN